LDLLFATYAYAFQIYNDFSGYSDIAIGSALCFGYVVPVNFDSPFRCSNPVDFWNRWHISLSHWVRDYLFYPLMMKSPIRGKVYLCLFTTTLAIGIWHGANWTFICFGFYHAILGVFHRALSPQWLRLKQRSPLLYRCFAWWIYWNLLTVGMFFFRCEGFDQILTGMHRFWFEMSLELIHTPSLKMLFVLCMAMVSHWPRSTTWEAFALSYVKFPLLIKVITVWLVFCVATFGAHLDQGRAAFIYFRF
jgi:D-alanyl-lipoteichoic acid acyltransferase DltB (MBOAT superfamily)